MYQSSYSVYGSGSVQPKRADIEQKLAAHVPDLVVFDESPDKIPHILKFDGVLLFADVSGFTALTEKYTMSSEKGTDALTVTLNNYIGKIVTCILKSGGDILKFAGDAILAVWKVKKRSDLLEAISQAARCSLIIQDQCDNQDTDVGVKLRVKIAISAGKIYATFVGNNDSRHFVMAGRPVREVNAAEKYCTAGLVVLSPNAMELSDKSDIITEALENRFGLVKYLRGKPRKSWKEYVDLPFAEIICDDNDEGANVRISLNHKADHHRELTIRKYVTPVVQRKLDDGQLLKFLSEMRQCSILFINLAFELNEKDRLFHQKQCINMQTAFSTVYSNVHDMQGSLNKIFMFDKGCTFLVIFGLPGDKHEQEPAHALQASWKISQELHKELPSLNLASFGVTTGPVFCGVIGHDERHEYTVIGQKVNLAARLMMHYPNIVACDFETYHDSKLSKDMFTTLPTKAMKGVGQVSVHEYKEGERKVVSSMVLYKPEFPLIGRDAEMDLFMEELHHIMISEEYGRERRVIIFEGEAGYGKTRLMKEIEWKASIETVLVVSYTLSINDLNTPYFAIKVLMDLLLKTKKFEECDSKEEILTEILGIGNADLLCLLNDILNLRFPMSSKASEMNCDVRAEVVRSLLNIIVRRMTANQFVLFALDDAQNVDVNSWALLSTLSKDPKALCVLAMRPFSPDRPSCEPANTIIYHHKTLYVKLSVLMNEDLTPLACQLLKVDRIPLALRNILIQRSHGVPLWCEQLLREMQNAGVLLLEKVLDKPTVAASHGAQKENNPPSDSTLKPGQFGLTVHRSSRLRKSSVFSIWSNVNKTKPSKEVRSESGEIDDYALRQRSRESLNEPAMECLIKPNFDLNKFPVPASIRGMALARLDRMKPFEQLVVKSAAVIGNNMSRKMLQSVVPGFNEDKFKRAILQLMSSRVFECASIRKTPDTQDRARKQSFQFSGRSDQITCFCDVPADMVKNENETDEEIAARCEQLRFHNSMVQETAYKLWLEEQRKSIHEACANYIEGKINEILSSGLTDEAISKQYHLSRNTLTEELALTRDTTKSESKALSGTDQKPMHQRVSVLSQFQGRFSQVSVPERPISTASARKTTLPHDEENSPSTSNPQGRRPSLVRKLQEASQRRFSLLSAPGKICFDGSCYRKSIPIPLSVTETAPPLDLILPAHTKSKGSRDSQFLSFFKSSKRFSVNQSEPQSETSSSASESSNTMHSSVWSQSKRFSSAYDVTVSNTEEHAKCLPASTFNKFEQSPFDIHENLALLYQQLIHHWRNARHTEKTLIYLLKAAESSIAILNLTIAFCYLQMANQIVENLAKGQDIVSNQSNYDDQSLEDVKLLSVSRVVRARIHKLMGQVLFQQGHLQASLSQILKALKILRCWLPRKYLFIKLQSWSEKQEQNKHLRKPNKYIGSAPCGLALKRTEEVQCLSYLWQILHKLPDVPNRDRLIKLVALMQVNKAETADFNLQDLITSYTYMMQLKLISGNLMESALYESKAMLRCSELPPTLTTSQLYVIGHLHLVCCSLRMSHGKLELAIVSGHRAYNVADFLGDLDIKLICLPLLAQAHLLSGRGRSSVDALKILYQLSNVNDDIGLLSYFTTCFDLILDGGFAHESASTCVEYLQNTEVFDIGDPQRFYVRTLLAVWYYRKEDRENGRLWLELIVEDPPQRLDNVFSARAFARQAEAALLAFMLSKNALGLEHKDTKAEEAQCREVLKEFQKLTNTFQILAPRTIHFNALFQAVLGNTANFSEQMDKAMKSAQFFGNLVDHQWAYQTLTVNLLKQTPYNSGYFSYWKTFHECFPIWEKATKTKPSERAFIFPF